MQDLASPNHQYHLVQDTSSKQQTRQKQKSNHQQKGSSTHSALPSEEKQRLSTNLTLYEAYTNSWANLRRAENKRKKEFNLFQGKNSTFLEDWESSVQSLVRVRLCDPMNRSTPDLPVHHQLLEFTHTHVHRVSDAIQPFHPLSSPSPPAPNPSQLRRAENKRKKEFNLFQGKNSTFLEDWEKETSNTRS